jgi:hypothetical protein
LVLGWKEFNSTPWFYSLPQGERRIERISPSPLPSPARGEGRGEREDGKILTAPLTLTLSRRVERGLVKGEKG